MSKIDYQALREAAEKATPGNWWIDSHGQDMVSFIDNEVLEVFTTDNKRDAVRHEDTGNLSRWRNDNDATFIAKANPATVLALLDELDKWQQESSAWQAVAEKQLALASDAEKRIAELESLIAPHLPQPAKVSVPLAIHDDDFEKALSVLNDTLDDCGDSERGLLLAFDKAGIEVRSDACRAAMLQCANDSLAHDGKNHPEDKLGMVDHFGGSNNMVEPVTDNTNQQFESLSRGDK